MRTSLVRGRGNRVYKSIRLHKSLRSSLITQGTGAYYKIFNASFTDGGGFHVSGSSNGGA
jgi:hypothetical protein